MENGEIKIAPSTPTLFIATTILVTRNVIGPVQTLCQGRFGVFAS